MAQTSHRLPRPVPGRVHLLDGRTHTAPLVYVDYNKVKAVENGVETVYTPLEAGSFVIAQDSFVVLRDFKISLGKDEQEFRIAFVRVSVAGPGFTLYHFNGTMRREVPAHSQMMGNTIVVVDDATEYTRSKVWFIKKDNNPAWLSLPRAGRSLTSTVEPIIADDKKLARSVDWDFMTDNGIEKLLKAYVANQVVGPKQ